MRARWLLVSLLTVAVLLGRISPTVAGPEKEPSMHDHGGRDHGGRERGHHDRSHHDGRHHER